VFIGYIFNGITAMAQWKMKYQSVFPEEGSYIG
jgi:hypothetical protein